MSAIQNNMVSIPKITAQSRASLQAVVKSNLSTLVFRRVNIVHSVPNSSIGTIIQTPSGPVSQLLPELDVYSADQLKQNTIHLFKWNTLVTSPIALRGNDAFQCTPIFASAGTYATMDPVSFKLRHAKVPTAPPRAGDLVCGVIRRNSHQGRLPSYMSWFVCSEQFLHAWTAIMYQTHESFVKKGKESEPQLRQWLMSGNRLCTNGYRKYYYGCLDSGMVPEKLMEKYFFMRSEPIATEYVHYYAALVLAVKYGELPCAHNVPKNLDQGPNMTKWDLPATWLSDFVSAYKIQSTLAEEEVVNEAPVKVSPKVVEVKKVLYQKINLDDTVHFPKL